MHYNIVYKFYLFRILRFDSFKNKLKLYVLLKNGIVLTTSRIYLLLWHDIMLGLKETEFLNIPTIRKWT